ncbi:translation initiation factor [Sulfurimonas sp. MAG313]|nr:translation initiation factor [Sulfurimonas sp. MAG313]MDF1880232.1 translation initiation factor [Sulfurimonas sp. MAG313]
MSKGKKLDLNIGASWEDEWSEVNGKKVLKKKEIVEPAKHFLVFKFEKRKGKPVTLIGPFQIKKEETTILLKKIKKSLGAGGAYKEDFMEFQGDCKERLRELFTAQGFRLKK